MFYKTRFRNLSKKEIIRKTLEKAILSVYNVNIKNSFFSHRIRKNG